MTPEPEIKNMEIINNTIYNCGKPGITLCQEPIIIKNITTYYSKTFPWYMRFWNWIKNAIAAWNTRRAA